MSRLRHVTIEHPDLHNARSLAQIGFRDFAMGMVDAFVYRGRADILVEQPGRWIDYDDNAFQQWLHDLYADGSFTITEEEVEAAGDAWIPIRTADYPTTTTPHGDTDA